MDLFYSLAPLPSYPPAVASTFPFSHGSRPALSLSIQLDSVIPHGSHRAALVVTFTRGTHLTHEGTLNIMVP